MDRHRLLRLNKAIRAWSPSTYPHPHPHPHGGQRRGLGPSAQGQGGPGSSGLSQAGRAGSRPEKRGQLWGTGPRRAGTAAITSGLERAAGGVGRESGLISRPGTRAGAGAAATAAGAAQARPWQAGKAWAEAARREQACLPSFLGATRRSN